MIKQELYSKFHIANIFFQIPDEIGMFNIYENTQATSKDERANCIWYLTK